MWLPVSERITLYGVIEDRNRRERGLGRVGLRGWDCGRDGLSGELVLTWRAGGYAVSHRLMTGMAMAIPTLYFRDKTIFASGT